MNSNWDSIKKPIIIFASFALIIIIGLFLINALNIAYPLHVQTSQVSSELAVVGEGKVEAIPNSASVDVGIVVENAPTVNDAQKQITTANNEIVAALSSLGIPKEQIKTSNYNINPTYQYEGGPQRITGYSGNVTLTIHVKDISQLSQVITTALDNGANQVYNTSLTVDNPNEYREKARTEAINNAKQQAEKLAKELGIKLGPVVNIVESSGNDSSVYPIEKSFDRAAGGAAPDIQPGSQTIYSTVTLYFEKK